MHDPLDHHAGSVGDDCFEVPCGFLSLIGSKRKLQQHVKGQRHHQRRPLLGITWDATC